MKNPWLTKNPYLSLWLSGANSVAGAARGHATAAMKREAAKTYQTAVTDATQQVFDFWGCTVGSTCAAKATHVAASRVLHVQSTPARPCR